MIGLWDEKVVLQLSNGRRVAVPLMSLRSESRIQAQELAKKLASSRSDRINELRGQAVAAAAPAPDPLPQPPAASTYIPPTPGGSAADFLKQMDDAVSAGHIKAIYDALPPSYRADIDSLVQLAAQKTKPATWQSLLGSIHQVGELLVTRQNWFMSSPRISDLEPEQQEMIRAQVVGLADVIRVGLSPEAIQQERLQAIPFSEWLSERDQAIAPYLAQVFERSDTVGREITVESEQDGVAQVNMTQGTQTSKVTYVSVEGYWVPKSLADQWTEKVAAWRNEFDQGATSLDALATVMQTMASPTVQALASAQNAGQFHAAMQPTFQLAETALVAAASRFGGSFGLASTQQQRGGGYGDYGGYDEGYEGYGDEDYGMEDDYDMEMDMDMEDMDMEEMEDDYDSEMDMEEEEYGRGGFPGGPGAPR